MDCGYSLEPPRRGGSNEYPQSMFWAEMWKISEFFFLSENFQFLEVEFSIYLNRHVFVMTLFLLLLLLPASVAQSDVRPTGDVRSRQVGNILSVSFDHERSFSPFRWFKKRSCQFLAKECNVILVNRLED